MKETKLSTVIDVISMGPFGSDIKVDNFISQGIPVLNGSNLTSHKLVENSFKYVSLEKANKLGKANAFRGDIIITHRGTLGQVAYIPQNSKYERYVISQSQFRVRFNDDLDPIYFSYLMKSEYGQKKLLSFKSHVGVPALAQATSNFKRLELKLHNNIDQQKIAAVLSALDDKIELNNQINTELEAMAKTLYDYWFVQFDFPDENGKPYKSSGGKMVFNEVLKREIPVGWEVKDFGEVFQISRGTLVTKDTSTTGDYKVVAAGLNYSYLHGEFNREKFTITVSGSGANAGFVNFWTERIFASDCTTVRGETDLDTFLGLQFLKRHQNYIYSQAKGSAQPHVYPSDIQCLKCLNSNTVLEHKAGTLFKSYYEKIANNLQQNQELAQLRDWLLPMLMNGQVSVK